MMNLRFDANQDYQLDAIYKGVLKNLANYEQHF
jgi:hypothetical protein